MTYTLKQYSMDIQAKIDELNKRKEALEKTIEDSKEEIKKINIQGRKLQTILKHAEAALNDQEPEPAEHSEA